MLVLELDTKQLCIIDVKQILFSVSLMEKLGFVLIVLGLTKEPGVQKQVKTNGDIKKIA